MLQKRDIVTGIILSILTCGIYSIFWMINITNDTMKINKDQTISGGTAFLLNIITCGIYGIYWNYKIAQCIYESELKKGLPATNNAAVCLILSVVRLDIVSYCILQSELNRFADNGK